MKNYLSIKKTLLSALLVLFTIVTTYAVEVTVNFTNSNGDPIEGSQVKFKSTNNPWTTIGSTDVNGQIIAELGNVIGNATFEIS